MQLKALVVDDSRVMRNMVKQALEQSGLAQFDFVEAGNGSEGMDMLDQETIDIIFVDWNMPGMNGIEFAKEIRANQWMRHIPVIMITSESGDGKQQDAFDKARISCYITKPFTPEDVQQKVSPIIQELQKKRAEQPAAAPPAQAAPAPAAPAAKSGGFFSKLRG